MGNEIVVTFVHGTFAAGAQWMAPGSPLFEELNKRLSDRARFQTFRWSGKNTHSARVAAGGSLARLLTETNSKWPRARHCIIAHSHGGNIALYALRNESISSSVAGVATLATPFIDANRRDFLGAALTIFGTYVLATMVVPFCMCLLALYFLFRDQDALAVRIVVVSLLLAMVMAAVPWLLFDVEENKFRPAVGNRIVLLVEKLFTQQSEVVDTLGVPLIRSYPLFCVAVRGDETHLGLGTIDAVAGFPFKVLERMEGVVSETLDFTDTMAGYSNKVGIVLRPLQAISGTGGGLAAGISVVWAAFAALFILPATVVLLLLLGVLLLCSNAPRLRRMLYWGEELRASLLAEVFVRPRPAGSSETTVLKYYDVSPTARTKPLWNPFQRFVHCNVYEDPAVVSDVAAWIDSGCPPPVKPISQAETGRPLPTKESGVGMAMAGWLMGVVGVVGAVLILGWLL